MAKTATRSVELEPIDRLEEKMTSELSPAQLAAFERTLRSCVHMLGAGLPGP